MRKDFDIKKAMSGHPLCTRNEERILIWHYNPNATYKKQIVYWTKDGKPHFCDVNGNCTDLGKQLLFDLFLYYTSEEIAIAVSKFPNSMGYYNVRSFGVPKGKEKELFGDSSKDEYDIVYVKVKK